MPPKPPLRMPIPKRFFQSAKPKLAPSPVAKTTPRAPTAPPQQPSHTTPSPRRRWYQSSAAGHIALCTFNGLSGLCFFLWIRDHHIRLDHVRGSSMSPTLSPHAHETGDEDWVFIRPYSEALSDIRGGLQRGDVVTFWKPHNPEQIGIKRIVALEGDTVYPKRGYALEEQGKRLQGGLDGLPDEDGDSVAWGREDKGKVVVPFGHVWVEGDNWRRSFDSRDFGPVSKGLVEGRAVAVWRGWWDVRWVGDERDKVGRSKVVEGVAVVPEVFLE